MHSLSSAFANATATAGLALLLAGTAMPGLAQTHCATVEVDNVRPRAGHLMVAAYNSADSFSKAAVTSLRLPAGDSRTSFQLCGLSGTHVALTLFQDIDSDGKMGRNMVGMPTEPWGSSGTPGSMGPSWDGGKVALDGKPIAVRLSQ